MVMFRWMPFAAIFLHSLYIVVSSVFKWKGNCAMAPPLGDPLEKSETDSKGRLVFRDYYIFGTKT